MKASGRHNRLTEDNVAGSLVRFQEAIDAVPSVLLDSIGTQLLADAKESASQLRDNDMAGTTVVIAGQGGVGKSYVFNELVGAEVSESGVLRPTTRRPLVAGIDPPMREDGDIDTVVVPGMPSRLRVVDTQPWELDREAVADAIQTADVAVLVVSPSRYGDAATMEVWDEMRNTDEVLLVANRLPDAQDERTTLIASIVARFGVEPVAILEGGGSEAAVERILAARRNETTLSHEQEEYRFAAKEAGRSLATALTAAAADLAIVEGAVRNLEASSRPVPAIEIRDSWLATHQDVVNDMSVTIERIDRRIVAADSAGIAERMAESLGVWEASHFEGELDAWRVESAESFRLKAKPRWRKAAAYHSLEQASWRVAIRPEAPVARRVRKLLKTDLDAMSHIANDGLRNVLAEPLAERLSEWRRLVDGAGAYKPGELLVASNGLNGT